MFSVEHGGSVA